MRNVRRVIGAVARDDAAARFLRHDPSALAKSLDLADPQIEAMRSADRFFAEEKPILDRAVEPPSRPPLRQAAVARFVAADVAGSAIVVSADTGTLLPGPNTGTFTLTSTATATTPPPVAPSGPPDVPRAPAVPIAPQVPVTPRAPETPQVPVAPSAPAKPAVPCAPATPTPCPTPVGHCCSAAAVVAIVANVSTTAVTAITAISAIARQGAAPGCQPPTGEEQR